MTASIKEALAAARQFVEHAPGSNAKATLAKIDAALASLSCGEARERIARIIHGDDKNFDELKDIASSHGPYNHYREFLAELYAKADAILATGCVTDEAAIRADQKERDARIAEQFGEPYALNTNTGAMMFRAVTDKIVAAIRAGRGEG